MPAQVPGSEQDQPGYQMPDMSGRMPPMPLVMGPDATAPQVAQQMPPPDLVTGMRAPQQPLAPPAQAGVGAGAVNGMGLQPQAPAVAMPTTTKPSSADPMDAVMAKIASGESGGPDPYHETYGGGHFGWQGEPGTGSGRYGFVKSTWGLAAKEWMARNPGQPAPDFNKPEDQNKVGKVWAVKSYGVDSNGLTLPQAAAAGKVDWDRLHAQWPSLPLSHQWQNWLPEEEAKLRERTAASQQASANMMGVLQQYVELANTAPEGSKERDAAIAQLRANSAEMMKNFREKVMQPPMAQPVDAWKNMGSAGFILAALAGLMSRQHLTAGLTAAGAALKAINENSKEEYQRQYQIWRDQVSLGAQMISMENQDIRALLEDKHTAFEEKQARMATMLTTFGLVDKIGQNNIGNIDAGLAFVERREKAAQAFQQTQATLDSTNAYRAAELGIKEATLALREQGKWELYRLQDEKGKSQTIKYDATTGKATDLNNNPIALSPDAQLIPLRQATAGGGRENTQINAMVGSSNEAVADLSNLMELPIGANAGVFMGVQTRAPNEIAEAWKRSLASTLTSEESKDVIVTAQGIQREMATMEAQGRATGLVGLTGMADTLIPQVNDPGPVVLRKYAQIRQIADRNIDTILARSNVDPQQRKLLEQNREELRKAVPFTVHDVNLLERALHSGASDETVAEYARRMFRQNVPTDLPSPSGLAEGTVAKDKQSGQRWIIRSGKWEQDSGG